MATVEQKIILGLGAFQIDDTEIALTRGGGTFVVEREYRTIEADGMKSAGKNMIVIDREQPKLTMNALSIFAGADLTKLYPAMESKVVEGSEAGTEITSNEGLIIKDNDYHSVKWVGKTNDNKGIIITIEDAINLENINWSMVDKDEIVQALTFTGVADTNTKQCRYSIKYLD